MRKYVLGHAGITVGFDDPQRVFDRDWKALDMAPKPATGSDEGTPKVKDHGEQQANGVP